MSDLKVYKGNGTYVVITLNNYLEYEEIFKNVDIIDCNLILLHSGVMLNLSNVILCKNNFILSENSKLIANELLECCSVELYEKSTFIANKLTKATTIILKDDCVFDCNVLKEVHALFLSFNSTYKIDILEKCDTISLMCGSTLITNNLKECNEIYISNNVEMEKYLYEKFPNTIFNIDNDSTRYIINKKPKNAKYYYSGLCSYNSLRSILNRDNFLKIYDEKCDGDDILSYCCDMNYVYLYSKTAKFSKIFDVKNDYNIVHNSLNYEYEIVDIIEINTRLGVFFIAKDKKNDYFILDMYFNIVADFHQKDIVNIKNDANGVVKKHGNVIVNFENTSYEFNVDDLILESKKLQNLKMFM